MIVQPVSGHSYTHVHRHHLYPLRSHQILRRKENREHRASQPTPTHVRRPGRNRAHPGKSLLSSMIPTAKPGRRGNLLQSVNAGLKTRRILGTPVDVLPVGGQGEVLLLLYPSRRLSLLRTSTVYHHTSVYHQRLTIPRRVHFVVSICSCIDL